MLRLAFDARDALAADARGWGRYARELLRGLRSVPGLGIAALDGGGGLPEVVWEQGVLPVRLARLSADVVHSPSCFLPLARPCAGVVSIHDLAFEAFPDDFPARTGAKFRFFTPRAARSAERVVTGSAFTREDLCERYGLAPGMVTVIPDAPALKIGTAPVPRAGRPYVLGVGDLRAKKNWPRLARAMRALPDHRLVLAGMDAGQGAELRALGAELTGYVDDAALDALMRGADVLCHPSLYEGFGLVVVEAMARGVPVACADATALPEAAGGAAVLFDPLDEDAIAAALHAALADRERLAAAGRARAAALSWERTAALTAAVYREAAAAR